LTASSIKKIQDYLKEHGLDAFLVLTKLNRQYLSGFTGSVGAVLVTKRGGELFVDNRYTIRAKRESNLKVHNSLQLPLRLRGRAPSLRVREGRGELRIGIEDKISLQEFKRLKQDYKGVKWVTTSNVIEDLRAIKSVQEIKFIEKAQSINDRIFAAVRKSVRPGQTEMQISQKMEQAAIKLGADGMAFESIVAFGANAAAPHHLSGKQKIKKNNFLLLDFGVLVNGYHSDFTRTLFIGGPTKRQEKIYKIVLEAQIRGIREIGIEKSAVSVDKAVRKHIERAGFGKYFTHNTGHGVGLEIHELPNFSPKSGDILQNHMIVTIEPGIYIESWGGVRIEDMVLVSGSGPVILSRSPKDLKSMIIK